MVLFVANSGSLKLIEAYGTGLPKITESYRDAKEKPIIEVSNHAFKITLPNMNFQPEINTESYQSNKLSIVEEEVMTYLVVHNYASRQEIQKALDLSQSKAIRTLKTLLEKQLVEPTGGGRTITYSMVRE
jgi:ATP-dependent DNA helicase RecG